MIVAVDGPAASGKGTIARAVAAAYGLPHMDTGALYRAVGLAVLNAGGDPEDEVFARRCAEDFPDALLADPAIRGAAAARAASIVSAHPAVRAALIDRQRRFAGQPGGAVLDGRDIGTVIAPQAEVKIFVTASLDERARRRHAEALARGAAAEFEAVRSNLAQRDERDSGRSTAPMRRADDALLLDTTELDVEAAIAAALAHVERSKAAPVRQG